MAVCLCFSLHVYSKIRFLFYRGDIITPLELRARSQITLPKAIVEKFSLTTGDKLNVVEQDVSICLIPGAVYPKAYAESHHQGSGFLMADVIKSIFDNRKPVCSVMLHRHLNHQRFTLAAIDDVISRDKLFMALVLDTERAE